MSKVSVILPCYKVEKFLPFCLESLSNQTLTDFEVICVDDGSPDNCGKILDEYAAKDKRFRVIHQQNGGLSVARNSGIAQISAPYTMFVDSDDALHPQTLELALSVMEKQKADIVWFDVIRFMNNDELVNLPVYNQPSSTIFYTDPLSFYAVKPLWRRNKSERMVGVVWNKIYRSDLVKEILFEPRLSPGEDNLFTLEMTARTNSVVHLKMPLYCYRNNANSIMQTLNQEKIAKNLPIEMNGYLKMQKRVCSKNIVQSRQNIIKRYVASFYFKQIFRPFLRNSNLLTGMDKDYIEDLLYNSEIDFNRLNIRHRIPVFLYKNKFIKLARLCAI